MRRNPARENRIRELRMSGHTISSIAKITGIPPSTVGYYAKKIKGTRTQRSLNFRSVEPPYELGRRKTLDEIMFGISYGKKKDTTDELEEEGTNQGQVRMTGPGWIKLIDHSEIYKRLKKGKLAEAYYILNINNLLYEEYNHLLKYVSEEELDSLLKLSKMASRLYK